MCGIAGLLDPRISKEQREQIVRGMCATLRHRGPNHSGISDLGGLCIGMSRLSIIDLSECGDQPMTNADQSKWIVYNGEVYNFKEERSILEKKGHIFFSNSDTEVVLKLYEEYGFDCLSRLRGMFAFCIWDATEQTIFIARDRLGIKPLYYVRKGNVFAFASEVKSLVKHGLVEPHLNLQALDHYLSYGCVPTPDTLFKEVHALPPGYAMLVRGGDLNILPYWDLPVEGATQCKEEDVLPSVRHLVEESITLRQVSDVPLGAFLSGGIDSTAVVGIMAQQLGQAVRTFSVGFKDVPERFNELTTARRSAQKFHTEHTEVIFDGGDVRDELDSIVWHIDQPSADGINSYFVSKAAKEGGLTVALSGLGGDEVFGGYGTYQWVPKWGTVASAWGKIPQYARDLAQPILKRMSEAKETTGRWHKLSKLHQIDSALSLYGLARLHIWPDERRYLYSAGVLDTLQAIPSASDQLEGYTKPSESLWQTVMRLEMRNFMGHRLLHDTDVMSMAHSLEVRVPLIDHLLVEFVAGLPRHWHKNDKQPKQLLTQAFHDVIPQEVIFRRKQGFELPMSYWMKNELRPVVEDVFSVRSIENRGLFDAKTMRALYQRFLRGHQQYTTVWQFVMLELWLRAYVDASITESVAI